jgi:hypothetical protein
MNPSLSELQQSFRQVSDGWSEARAVWRDSLRRSFELNCWQPFETRVRALLSAAEHAQAEIDAARRSLAKR